MEQTVQAIVNDKELHPVINLTNHIVQPILRVHPTILTG